ncbi:MAG TPA: hypothetical protein VJO33_02205 [Gemmatimonadaceae bacterium]|nr:hypothetical protein [Gemmatimonadaceae bacterium]
MAFLSHRDYDALERAIRVGQRIVVWRAGIEYVVVPTQLRLQSGREVIDARRPTGDSLTVFLDEIDALEVVT